MSLLEPIFEELNRANVRYVVVGGLATVLHGFARLTADVDLVVDLEPKEAEKAIHALVGMGFRPRVPVPAMEFADAGKRREWIRDKHMRVFPLSDPTSPMRQVDLFVESPIDFELLWSRSEQISLERTVVRIASIPDLITMKRQAGRSHDLVDIEALERILAKRGLP